MPLSFFTTLFGQCFTTLAAALDPRSATRYAQLLAAALVACGRRTVTAWIRAAGRHSDFRACYTTIAAAGRRADTLARRLVQDVLRPGPLLQRLLRVDLALDDTPTPRYGPHVQGAGIHHNPTPGPAGSAYVYGHVWVTLALLLRHPLWGVLALPLLARLDIRKTDLSSIDPAHRPAFRTKLELAVELVEWAKTCFSFLGLKLRVVVDGAYAKRAFLGPVLRAGVVVVSRLPSNAALYDQPPPRRPGQRGRPRVRGARLSLRHRAAAPGGWQTGTFQLYGAAQEKRYKTFVALWPPAGGLLRVVLVREDEGSWRAYFCTDPTATVADILEVVADRFTIETAFRDLKEIVGAGQQQTRFHGANVGSYHTCLWALTLTEVWAWERSGAALLGQRSASPWDRAERRPSHADKRRAFRRELLGAELTAVCQPYLSAAEIQRLSERLLALAA